MKEKQRGKGREKKTNKSFIELKKMLKVHTWKANGRKA